MKMQKLKTLGMFAFCASLCVVGAVSLSTAYADGTAEPTLIENDDGFYMSKGAQVRIPTATQEGYDGTGIRFAVNLQSAYLEQLESTYETVTFYSLIAVNGASATVPNGFTGEESTTVIDNVALLEWREGDYGTLEDGVYTYYITPTNMQKGYDIELTVGAVAKVTDAQGEVEYLYAKANDNTRTMEAVALAAYLDNKTDSNYAYLNKYYGTATEYKGSHVQEYGDSTVSFTSDITVAELSENAYACIGATKVALADGKVAIDSAEAYLTAGETYTVSIFDGDKVYTKDMLYITRELNQASDLDIFTLKKNDVTGYYLVTTDIDASNRDAAIHDDYWYKETGDATYDFDYSFKGTFDGDGHTVKANVRNCGLFGVLKDATIINTNFVLNVSGTTSNSGYNPTGLAWKTLGETTISNVYAELNPANGLTVASGRTWALSLISNVSNFGEGHLTTENVVVVNNDNFDTLSSASTYCIGGALFYADASRGSSEEARDEYMTNVFVIAPERLGENQDGHYVPMASGQAQQTFASNDGAGKAYAQTNAGSTQNTYANVTRYSTVKAFVESLAWENKIPNFIMENLLVNGTTISVGETDLQDKGEIALPLNEEQQVTLQIGEKALTALELSCVDGEEFVAINGDAFALTGVGTATLTATGKFGEISVAVTFTVSLKSTTHEGEVLFSGEDGDVDVKAIFGEGATLASAYGTDGTVYEVADNKIKGLTNETNAPVKTTLLLASEENTFVYVTFNVYTQLLDHIDDLAIFNLTDKNITGCYRVITDLDASGVKATMHKDLENWNSSMPAADQFAYKFTGLFDGDSHTVKVNVKNAGLFGVLENATIQNVNFIFNISGQKYHDNYYPTGLAHQSLGKTKLSNIYAELNPATDLLAASSRNWALSLMMNGPDFKADQTLTLQNVVVVNNDNFAELQVSTSWRTAGALFFADAGRSDGLRTAYMTNVYIIAPEFFGEKNTNNTTTGYVAMASATALATFAKNDEANKNTVATALGKTLYVLDVTRYSNVNAFVDSNVWKDKIPTFIMTAVNAHYVTAPQS